MDLSQYKRIKYLGGWGAIKGNIQDQKDLVLLLQNSIPPGYTDPSINATFSISTLTVPKFEEREVIVVDVVGADRGDIVVVSQPEIGLIFKAVVKLDDKVTIIAINTSGLDINLSQGSGKLRVLK